MAAQATLRSITYCLVFVVMTRWVCAAGRIKVIGSAEGSALDAPLVVVVDEPPSIVPVFLLFAHEFRLMPERWH